MLVKDLLLLALCIVGVAVWLFFFVRALAFTAGLDMQAKKHTATVKNRPYMVDDDDDTPDWATLCDMYADTAEANARFNK